MIFWKACIAAVVSASGFAQAVDAQTERAVLGEEMRLFHGSGTNSGGLNDGPVVPATALPDRTWIVPLHVAKNNARTGSFDVPRGYRPAWEDDRLNPHRAIGTLQGRNSMNEVWTPTVPRRLEEPSARSGRQAPALVVHPTPPAGDDPVAAHDAGWGR